MMWLPRVNINRWISINDLDHLFQNIQPRVHHSLIPHAVASSAACWGATGRIPFVCRTAVCRVASTAAPPRAGAPPQLWQPASSSSWPMPPSAPLAWSPSAQRISIPMHGMRSTPGTLPRAPCVRPAARREPRREDLGLERERRRVCARWRSRRRARGGGGKYFLTVATWRFQKVWPTVPLQSLSLITPAQILNFDIKLQKRHARALSCWKHRWSWKHWWLGINQWQALT
jgi:hypothetical protein